jgi:hypothetical protein
MEAKEHIRAMIMKESASTRTKVMEARPSVRILVLISKANA